MLSRGARNAPIATYHKRGPEAPLNRKKITRHVGKCDSRSTAANCENSQKNTKNGKLHEGSVQRHLSCFDKAAPVTQLPRDLVPLTRARRQNKCLQRLRCASQCAHPLITNRNWVNDFETDMKVQTLEPGTTYVKPFSSPAKVHAKDHRIMHVCRDLIAVLDLSVLPEARTNNYIGASFP